MKEDQIILEGPIIDAIFKKLEEIHGTDDSEKILGIYDKDQRKKISFYEPRIQFNKANIIQTENILTREDIIPFSNSLVSALADISDYTSAFKRLPFLKKFKDIKSIKNKKRVDFIEQIEESIDQEMDDIGIYYISTDSELIPFKKYLSSHPKRTHRSHKAKYYYIFKTYTEFRNSAIEYFTKYWNGNPDHLLFGLEGQSGFTYLSTLKESIDSLVRCLNSKQEKWIPSIVYHLTEEWFQAHVELLKEPIIQKAKERENWGRKSNAEKPLYYGKIYNEKCKEFMKSLPAYQASKKAKEFVQAIYLQKEKKTISPRTIQRYEGEYLKQKKTAT